MNPNGLGASRIDRIYIRDDWLPMVVSVHTDVPPISTDHRMVTTYLKQNQVERGPGRWRLDPELLKQTKALKIILAGKPGLDWGEWKVAVVEQLQRMS